MTNLYEHTVWCCGTHDRDGECIKEAKVGSDRDDAVVRLNGVPGDHQYIEFDGVLTEPGHIDAAVAILAGYREDLAAQDEVEAQLDWDAYDAANDEEG
jgi:hypothetical protein